MIKEMIENEDGVFILLDNNTNLWIRVNDIQTKYYTMQNGSLEPVIGYDSRILQ